jgi:hypothetical protein
MATPFEFHGNLAPSGDSTVDNTSQSRWVRVRAYNADTVNHTMTWKKGTTPVKKTVLAPGQDDEYGPVYCPSGTNIVINNAEATTTTAPTYEVNGEF